MKWFKHFCDSHRGKSLRAVRKIHGMDAVGMYWTLLELCAEKLEPDAKGKFNDSACVFDFEPVYLAGVLGTKGDRLAKILATYTDLQLMIVATHGEGSAQVLRIKMPKLLEYKHRDAFRSSKTPAALQRKKKIKNKDLEKEKKKKEKAQTPAASPSDEEKQMVFPGLLKPGDGVSALDLLESAKKAANTSRSGGRKAQGLVPIKDVIQKTVAKEGS